MSLDRRLFLAGSCAALLGAPARAVPPPVREQAIMADELVRRLAVNTHLTWDTPLWNSQVWWPLFGALGIRKTRSRIGTSKSALRTLTNIDVRIINRVGQLDLDDFAAGQAEIDFAAANASLIIATESPNEINSPVHDIPDWAVKLRAWCEWLYNAHNASSLADKPVIGPSIWGRETSAYNRLGDISATMDIGNLHYYTGGRKPTEAGFPDSYDEGGDPDHTYSLDDAIREAHIISADKPLWITETNWAVAGPGCPLSAFFVTDKAAAKYLLRALCENHNRGIELTSIYSLIDDVHRDPPRYHGLLTGLFEPRPQYYAVKNFTRLFSDRGPDFVPGRLRLAMGLRGCSRLPLMQKRDGRFLLTLWQDAVSYDRDTYDDIDVPPVPVQIDFARMVDVRVFAPTVAEDPIAEQINVSSYVAPVTDALMVIEISR